MGIIERLKERLQGYALKIAARKGGKVLINVLTSGTAALWLQDQATPYLIKYGPLLDKFGIHIDPAIFFVSLCGVLATGVELGIDAYGVSQENKSKNQGVMK